MFDRIVVYVIDMLLQVQIVTYLVFPKSPLPDTFLAFRYLAIATLRRSGQSCGERAFDQTPAESEICVALG